MGALKRIGNISGAAGDGIIHLEYIGGIIFFFICFIIFIVSVIYSISYGKKKFIGKCSGVSSMLTRQLDVEPARWPNRSPDVVLLPDKDDCCNSNIDCKHGSTCIEDPSICSKDKNAKWAWIIGAVFLLFGIIAFVIGKKQKDFIDNASPEANDYKKFRGALFGIDVIRSI